jgi:ABC-type lipoprotein release transport system permease subunit
MREYIKLAWRNIWRNKRRTLITAASIFFAIFFALIMRALQLGSYSNMIDNAVRLYSGHIQIHADGYWDNKSINNTLVQDEELRKTLRNNERIKQIVPRLESFALGSSGPQTKGVLVMGVKPGKQDSMSNLSEKLVEGAYFQPGENAAIIGETLSEYLQLGVKDTLVLLGQGYHGATAAGKYTIKGIVKIPKPDLDNKIVYLPLETSQRMYMAYNRLTTLAINLYDHRDLSETVKGLKQTLPDDKFEVKSWREIMPELVQQIQSDNASGWILLAILYLIIAFGVFGTVMMMITERKREFGVMIAVGMHKFKLALIVTVEMIFIGLLGLMAGIIGSMPVILYYHYNPIRLSGEVAESIETFGIEPIMPMAWQADFYINQTLIVAVIVIVSVLYPIYSITRIKAVKAMRG